MRGETGAEGLSAAAIALLEAQVLPQLAGEARFRTLLALAALRMADRERVLAERIAAAAAGVQAAAGAQSLEALRDALRRPGAEMSDALHQTLSLDAILRTAVSQPGQLTDGERLAAGL